jgi:aspartyl/asparaginyl-tRNA synthetase
MVEPEIAFADLAADADLAESFLKYILTGAARTSAATT